MSLTSPPPLWSNPTTTTTTGRSMATSSTTTTTPTTSSNNNLEQAAWLLESVYGPIYDQTFPRPMPATEAGLCADGHQRRYLWTDAFGVLAYTSLAQLHQAQQGNSQLAQAYQHAADRLIHTVHRCLGTPRSHLDHDAMTMSQTSPTGFVGLRIGKLHSRPQTDYGMKYDGMYWHYMDKWLLALTRSGHTLEAIQIAKSSFPYFFDEGPHGTGKGGGIRWKLSVNASAPPSLRYTSASDDTLVAYIVFSILEAHRSSPEMPSLHKELAWLETALKGYQPRVTDDPLGWGLEAFWDQYLEGQPRQTALAKLHTTALHPSHMSLPFRLYGAMMGAKIAGSPVAPPSLVQQLETMAIAHEQSIAPNQEEHSSINRVMLAMCLLCPDGALARQPHDPLLSLPK